MLLSLPSLSDACNERLMTLLRIFLAENQKLNLSALRTEDACWTGNILDSLAFLDLFALSISPIPSLKERESSLDILEVGVGGGFPLLPIAICMPDCHCTGIEATSKKVAAVQRIAGALGLRNVSLVAGRAESIGHDPVHRERYDIVLARALADLPVLLEFCAPFCRIGGCVVAWKSMSIEEEIARSAMALRALRCTLTGECRYDLGSDFGARQLLVFHKDAPTPSQYPRRDGIPQKRPLR